MSNARNSWRILDWFRKKRPRRRRTARPVFRTLELERLEQRELLAGDVTGRVFQDFNANGVFDTSASVANDSGDGSIGLAIDRGLAGVTVQAFDSVNVLRGSATTGADGTYTLAATDTGPYRIAFTGLPAGFFPGPRGPDSRSTIQFVPDGASNNISLGLVRSTDFVQNNPDLVTSAYVFGDPINGPNADQPAIVSIPYSAGGVTAGLDVVSDHALAVPGSQVGSTWGLGFDVVHQRLYAASFFKRHAGFGPNGTGAIYAMGRTGTTATLFADLNAIFGIDTAGPNLHDTNDYNRDNGNIGWDAVGKSALGGLAVSDDGRFVYVVNLADRMVYEIPTSGPLTPATIRRVAIPVAPGATGTSAQNPLGDLRPFALESYRGQLFVGMVNSAESTQQSSDLRAYVYAVDPATLTFGSAPAFQTQLDYPRLNVIPTASAAWLPWAATFQTISDIPTLGIYPQPMLTGIAFDEVGNMVLGFRDRSGDQFGNGTNDNPDDDVSYFAITGGDILRAFINTSGNLNSGWTLENNGRGPAGQGLGPQDNDSGPGGGEFYFNDSFQLIHDEIAVGGVALLPGHPDVVFTGMDVGSDIFAGGVRWHNNSTGDYVKAFQLYPSSGGSTGVFFGKANGLGDLTVLGNVAPLEIGDRVWRDINHNGLQDANEPGIAGVTVQLFRDGNLVATAVTDAEGIYLFNRSNVMDDGATPGDPSDDNQVLPNTAYEIRLDVTQAALAPFSLTGANLGADDAIDSDAVLNGATAVISLTTGAAGASDHTFDAGFQPLTIGNLVWNDLDNNGIRDPGEPGIAGVTVRLLNSTGTAILATTTTDANGTYLFGNLAPDTYMVSISAPAGFISSTGTNGSATGPFEPAPNPDNDVDDDDNGTTASATDIVSGTITLTLGGEPVNDGDNDANTNLTVDFGLFQTTSVGDRVWFDDNNNGIQDAGEGNVAGVTVRLFDASDDTLIGTAVTGANGLYGFINLKAGSYYVVFDLTTLPAGGVLTTRGPIGTKDANDSDPDPATGRTETFALAALENDTSWDAGVFRPLSLGNLVWNDANNNGRFDDGESGIDGVTVRLFTATGTTPLMTTTTNATGHYLFTGLTAGNYIVEIVAPTGFASSTGSAGTATGPFEPAPDPDDDVDDDDNGTTSGAVIRSAVVTLSPGDEPTGEPPTPGLPDNALDNNSNLTVDFGVFQAASIGDRVFFDNNRNGLQDVGETGGVPNVAVRLFAGTTVVATTTTDSNGFYSFPNLLPGSYSLTFDPATLPAGSSFTTRGATGAKDPDDSDPDPLTGVTETFNLDAGENDNSWDAGVIGSLSLGNLVWNDLNNNGRVDTGEPGISGVTVRLLNVSGTLLVTTTTNSTGHYLFTGLSGGDYIVEILPPTGFFSSTGTNGSLFGPFEPAPSPENDVDNDDNGTTLGPTAVRSGQVTLAPGTEPTGESATVGIPDSTPDVDSNLTVDFGLYQRTSVAGFVFIDANRNGVRDSGETGIANVTITLRDSANVVVGTVPTAADGAYSFSDIVAATYTIVQTQPAAFGSSTPNTLNVNVPAAGLTNQNFGETTATLSGAVFADFNNDGVRGGPDTGIANVTIILAGTDVNGAAVNRSTTTAADGSYSFSDLLAGTYTLAETQPSAFFDGRDITGSFGGNTSVNDRISAITVPGGETGSNYNFAEIPMVSPSGFVFEDRNNNGVRDTGEPGIPGVTVTLSGTDVNNNPVTRSLATDANGFYQFLNVPTGVYSIRELQPANFLDGRLQNGVPAAASAASDLFSGIDLRSAPFTGVGYNFGELRPSSLAGFVYIDNNRNGQRDAGDAGRPSVTVRLTGSDDRGSAVNLAAATDTNGFYQFTALRPGTYGLTRGDAAPFQAAATTVGSQGGTTGTAAVLNIGLGQNVDGINNNFGLLPSLRPSKFWFLVSTQR